MMNKHLLATLGLLAFLVSTHCNAASAAVLQTPPRARSIRARNITNLVPIWQSIGDIFDKESDSVTHLTTLIDLQDCYQRLEEEVTVKNIRNFTQALLNRPSDLFSADEITVITEYVATFANPRGLNAPLPVAREIHWPEAQ